MAYTDIDKPSDYFNTKLYAGNGSTQSITGVGFKPDFVWTKGRSGTYGVSNHKLYDVVRGATKSLFGNLTLEEYTQTNTLTSFDSDGFSLGDDTNVNASSTNFVAWNWLAGGTGVSNTQGSIASTVSANTTAGFSIVSYTSNASSGSTVGHGLGVAPSAIIVKRRSSAEDWGVGHQSLGWTNFLRLNTTGASSAATGLWNDTAPSSTVFTLGNSGISNPGSSITMIAYCFAEKKGFSKFGSYTGNGSSDGTFVYTGFKPAYVMAKRTDSVASWVVWDNKRDIDNGVYNALQLNDSAAEITASYYLDFLSNGFKWRVASGATNASGGTYIFMAFAENPFTTSTGIPTTAR